VAALETARVTRARRVARLHGIYAVVNEGTPDPVSLARAALAAGVCVVQYRAKHGIVAPALQALRRLTAECDALLIVNDDARAAVEFGCDGVHLGPEDRGFADLPAVRAQLRDRLIGLSCGTPAEARAAAAGGADYLGIGAVYPTPSKEDAGAPIGLDGLCRVAIAGGLPAAAIGGIGPRNVAEVARSGVAMAAVISAIAGAADPESAARELVDAWEAAATR
jgi:thiamine-phosphate diphosphorylase